MSFKMQSFICSLFIFGVMQEVKIIECPRDAMRELRLIPTEKKIAYIQSLLNCGFDTIDFGSFVSPKAIPQMKDTAEVLSRLDLSKQRANYWQCRKYSRSGRCSNILKYSI